MKYIELEKDFKIPIFTEKHKLVILYFLENDNKPAYPTKISKDLKNRISRVWAIKICKELKKELILDYEKHKPPRQKNKTEWYYLRKDYESFLKIAYNFLNSYNSKEQFDFIKSNYVQELLDENFIRTTFFSYGIFIKIKYSYDDLLKSDKNRFYKAYKKYKEKNGKKYFISFKSESSAKIEKLRNDTPDMKFIVHPLTLSINFPIFPKQISDNDKENTFNELNEDYSNFDNLYTYSFVRRYYEKEPEEIKDFLEKYLILIQISPNALRDLLFSNLLNSKKSDSFNWNVLDRIKHLVSSGIESKLLPTLVIDVVYDLARIDKLPVNSIVKQARVLFNPDNMKFDEPFLKLILENGMKYVFPLGFVLDKKGVLTFQFDTGGVE